VVKGDDVGAPSGDVCLLGDREHRLAGEFLKVLPEHVFDLAFVEVSPAAPLAKRHHLVLVFELKQWHG